jgi:putative phosphoribosyl transferase
MKMFRDRREAGELVAEEIKRQGFSFIRNSIVIALPRGGVVLGRVIAERLNIQLDVICPRKIGAPGNHEYAIGAVAESGEYFLDEVAVRQVGATQEYLRVEIEKQKAEADRRKRKYRGGRDDLDMGGKVVFLVDDGVATGSTMKAAIKSAFAGGAIQVIVAVPVGPEDSIRELEELADQVICLEIPIPFYAVGQFYERFGEVTDEEVIELLK